MARRKFFGSRFCSSRTVRRRLGRRTALLAPGGARGVTSAPTPSDRTSLVNPARGPVASWWVALGARMFGSSLDERLAAGATVEPASLLGTRAVMVASPLMRRSLSESWLGLLAQAREPPRRWDSRVPLSRRRILAAEGLIRDVAEALRAPVVSVRGVALACILLSDGGGPVYNESSAKGLEVALREVRQWLDPLSLWERT